MRLPSTNFRAIAASARAAIGRIAPQQHVPRAKWPP